MVKEEKEEKLSKWVDLMYQSNWGFTMDNTVGVKEKGHAAKASSLNAG